MKRDAVHVRLKASQKPAAPALSEKEFARLAELATRTTIDLMDRQLIESFVERIEIDPDAKRRVPPG